MTDQTAELPVVAEPGEEAVPEEAAGEFRPSAGGWAARLGVAALLGGAVLALPVILPFDFQANFVGLAAIYAIVALSMNILTGYLGQLSLGHQAFVGIGAFVSANLVFNSGLPFPVGLVVAGLTGALAALILGGVALRVRGLYLAIVTLAYGLLAESSLFLIRPLTGGGAGVTAPRPFGLGDRGYAYICIGVLVVAYLFDIRLVKSKAGRAIQAIRDDERVAASFGINITGYKLLAFILSGTYAGLAGALYGHWLGNVVSAPFSLQLALLFVLMTVVGGLGNRMGVVIGGAFFATITPLLDAFWESVLRPVLDFVQFDRLLELFGIGLPEGVNPVVEPIIGAALLVFTLIQYPGGIGQQLQPIQQWIRGGRFDLHLIHDTSAVAGKGGGVGGP